MPSGDAQRVWFPEMIAWLRTHWDGEPSIATLLQWQAQLDGVLGLIRRRAGLRTPIITCRHCGATGREPEPRVSVGATIAALGRFHVADPATVRRLKRDWATYRERHGLDPFGVPRTEQQRVGCSHVEHAPTALEDPTSQGKGGRPPYGDYTGAISLPGTE